MMADLPVPDGLTAAEIALFDLVAMLERDDYRSHAGVPATTTTTYIDAKTLICLLVLFSQTPGSRH
jgi:hypothetical protein